MEACCGAHWLARHCKQFGHKVKLIPAQHVKTHMNDYIDADAIVESATRPNMRFVSVKQNWNLHCHDEK